MFMHKLKGIPASPGIALGPVYLFEDLQLDVVERVVQDAQAELARLETALNSAKGQVEMLRVEAQQTVGEKEAAIFEAHGLFLEDPELLKSVHSAIENKSINCEFAWNVAIEGYAQQLEALEDEYFQARAADLRDVGRRVTRLLLGIEEVDLSGLDEPSIVVAKDLTPSDTVRLDKSMVKGFCTAEGGPTSHTAILAKALGIPAVVGVGLDLLSLESKTPLLIDGERGLVFSDPDQETRQEMQLRMEELEAQAAIDLSAAQEPAVTKDGYRVEVVANIGRPEETANSLKLGAEGIGLLRTEFLYLDKETAPDEEEQLDAYREILSVMGDRPVVVRTLDVGGDKPLPYLDLGEESNPFLGWRAIRMCLDEEDFFKIQLRALLRASPGHDLRIMFPMIATLDELRKAKKLLEEAREEVVDAGEDVSQEIQIGIMVEVPSVVLMADQFAAHVDFFSIGTNDLTQYTMAAERTNEKVAHLGDALHPAILRQIKMVIEAAHAKGIWVGLCGELAGDPQAIPILLGLGLDEFSMAPSMIPRAKALIRRWTKDATEELAARIIDLESAEAVREFIGDFQLE
jgi:phosphoenolpyruvate-protein phosphotransferase